MVFSEEQEKALEIVVELSKVFVQMLDSDDALKQELRKKILKYLEKI